MNAGRDYMSMRVVAPVLRMTATNARLADTLAARALDSADHYVDKYLPGDAAAENGDGKVLLIFSCLLQSSALFEKFLNPY